MKNDHHTTSKGATPLTYESVLAMLWRVAWSRQGGYMVSIMRWKIQHDATEIACNPIQLAQLDGTSKCGHGVLRVD